MKKTLAYLLAVVVLTMTGCSTASNPLDTGPQYTGAKLAVDVQRTANATLGWEGVTDVRCNDTDTVEQGVITDCVADWNGSLIGIRVTVDDSAGHFTMTRSAPQRVQ